MAGHCVLPADFQGYVNFFSIWGTLGGKHGLVLPYTSVIDGVKYLKSLGIDSTICSVWKLGGNPSGP